METICSRCGCSSFHYNRSRMRMECDQCGHPAYDPQQDQQLMQYDRTYSQAMNHLAAGNWEQVISSLSPLKDQYPTDKKLYLAILRAATRDFTDIGMDHAASRAAASEAWDKLIRLNGVTAAMRRYGRQRYEKHLAELGARKAAALKWIFASAVFSFVIGVLFASESYTVSVPCIFCLLLCLYKAWELHPLKVVKQLSAPAPDYGNNPFGREAGAA